MIYPSINDLTRGKYNRYTLVIATAKCARMVTDEYIKQREVAEKLIANKETDKSLVSMIKKEYRDEKAVKTAINKIYNRDYHILDSSISSQINFIPVDLTQESEEAPDENISAD